MGNEFDKLSGKAEAEWGKLTKNEELQDKGTGKAAAAQAAQDANRAEKDLEHEAKADAKDLQNAADETLGGAINDSQAGQ